MDIFVYGGVLFKFEVKKFLNKHDIDFIEIDNIDILKEKLQNNKDDIFVIDQSYIYTPNILSNKIKGKKIDIFYKNKVEKELLFKNNICFSTLNDLLVYIKNKATDDIIKENKDVLEDLEENLSTQEEDMATKDGTKIEIIEEKVVKDPAKITTIDEIEEEMLDEFKG